MIKSVFKQEPQHTTHNSQLTVCQGGIVIFYIKLVNQKKLDFNTKKMK